jgi:hypothetical protein
VAHYCFEVNQSRSKYLHQVAWVVEASVSLFEGEGIASLLDGW